MKSKHVAWLMALPLLFAGCGEKPGSSDSDTATIHLVPVEVMEVGLTDRYPVDERFVGKVEARRRSQLAFELGGIVDHVNFDEGETVKKGEILATIDTARLEARRNELQAVLNQAEATLKLAETTFRRYETLVKTQAVSVQELDNTRERFLTAQAIVSRTGAQLESVEVDLERSVLMAPFDGSLAKRGVDEGAVVSPNQIVFELLESSVLEVRAALAEPALAGIGVGDEVTVRFSPDFDIDLTVQRILPQRDALTRTVDVILSVPETLPRVRDGDLVTVHRFREIPETGFFLPRDALTESSRGLWACFIAVADPSAGPEAYRLDRRDLEVIHEYADAVYVRGSIDEGEWVLSSGLHKVAPGQRVRIVSVEPSNQLHDLITKN